MKVQITQTEEIRKYLETVYSQSGHTIFVTKIGTTRESSIKLIDYEGSYWNFKLPTNLLTPEDYEKCKEAAPKKRKKIENPDNPWY